MKPDPIWTASRDELVKAVTELGFPEELGHAIVKNLGWPKAMQRMTAYLRYAKPSKPEIVVDEMLAIRQEILTWQEKKASQMANAAYNQLLYEGLGHDNGSDWEDVP